LLQTENRLKRIEELLEVREPLYEEIADFVVNTDGITISKIVKNIQDIISTNA